MKKFLSIIMVVVIFLSIIPISSATVSAATNPYGKWQTISGVTTVRCTYYAWEQAYQNTGTVMPNFGNAKNWYSSAQNAGFSVGSTPKAKSIAVWTNSGYGHVAYVVSVNGSKMTVNEGGMLDTNGNAYNGDGIINGSTCNSTVGSNKSSYSSSVLVGFIYLTENGNSTGSVTITSQPNKNTISDTNAIFWGKVSKPSNYAVTSIGIVIRKDGSTYENGWSKYEAPSRNYVGYDYMEPYYNMNSELNLTLTHATKYWISFYAEVNGKEYWSPEYYFTTTGSHSFGSWSVTKAATCSENGTQTRRCKGCSKTETQTIGKLNTHTYSNDCDTSCNVCKETRKTTHRYNAGVVTKAATCKQAGVKTFTCTVCRATKTQAIAKIAHSYATTTTKATTSKNGKIVKKCSVCGVTASTTTVYYAKTIKLSATSYTYNGKAKTPTVTVKNAAGKTISKSYYTVKYASGRKNVGKYKVTITFKGNYSGTKTLYFTINPVKTSVSKITAAKKALTVTISKKSSQVTGYEIQYATNKKFTKAKTATIKSYKTTKTTLKKLSAKKTYYVRVRTYKTVSGKKYYSGWSTVKSKKTK